MRLEFALIAPLLLLLACGCNPPSVAPSTSMPPATATSNLTAGSVPAAKPVSAPAAEPAKDAAEPHYYLDHAQVGLPTARLWIGASEVNAEICATLPQVATGLMHRTGIGPNEAMLFVFGTGDRRSFYMKNVTFDIAAAYIDTEGEVREIIQLKRQEAIPVTSVSDNIQFVLETAPDWFTRNGVKPGTLIRTETGSLRAVLGPRAVLR